MGRAVLLLAFLSLFRATTGQCFNTPANWTDNQGSNCSAFAGYCTRGGGYARDYDFANWGYFFQHIPYYSDRSATGACCNCGANYRVGGCTTVELYVTAGRDPYFYQWSVLEGRDLWPVAAKYSDPYRRYLEPLCLLPGNYTFQGLDNYIDGGSVDMAWGNVALMPNVALAGRKEVPFPVPVGSGLCFRTAIRCPAHAWCIDTPHSYYCKCEPGYEMVNGVCVDVDECQLGTHSCDNDAYCNNTMGFYNCTCNPGFVGDGRTFCIAAVVNRDIADCTTVQIDVHSSTPSFDFGAGTPQEMGWRIDEAVPLLGYGYDSYTEWDTQFPPVFACLTAGTYTFRYTDRFGDGWGSGWFRVHIGDTDLIERTEVVGAGDTATFAVPSSSGRCFRLAPCGSHTVCVDTDDSYGCRCASPYVGDGVTCGNPCANASLCSSERVCVNVNATDHRCDCPAGYSEVAGSCQDIDECQQPDTCDANANCTNGPGNYSCACHDGYYGYDGLAFPDSCAALNRNVPGCVTVAVHIWTDAYPEQISWSIAEAAPSMTIDGIAYSQGDHNRHFVHAVCLLPGEYTFQGVDSGKDGWKEGGFLVAYGGEELLPFTNVMGAGTSSELTVPNVTSFCHRTNPCGSQELCLDTPSAAHCACQSGHARNGSGVCTGCTTFEVRVTSDLYPHQMAWQILDADGNVATWVAKNFMLAANRDYLFTKCLPGGNYSFVATDSFGDGWTTGGFRIDIGSKVLINRTAATGYQTTVPFAVPFTSGACGSLPFYKPCVDIVEACVDTATDQMCQCRAGTHLNATTGECDDIDECRAGTHNCHPNATCTNIVGHFLCSCNAGTWGDGIDCHGQNRDVPDCTPLVVQINAGQYPSEMSWRIVEAFPEVRVPVGTYIEPFTLHTMQVCLLPGTYTFDVYDRYGDGWDNGTFAVQYGIHTLIQPTEVVLFGFGTTFVVPQEIDECEVGSHNCHINAICTDLVSTFSCACKEGYYGNGVSCNGPEDFASCADLVGWADVNNYTCSDYVANQWCSDWWYGAAWNFDWGTFYDFRPSDGVGADRACCTCGLSRSPVQAVDCTVREWGPWGDCVAVDSGNCAATRQRSVATLPTQGGEPCPRLSETVPCSVCPRCFVEAWGDWACHSPGAQLRTRRPLTAPQGSLCPDLGELRYSADCAAAADAPAGYLGQTFGQNGYGQLGLSDRISRSWPESAVPYPFGLPIQLLQLGGDHSAAVAGGLLFTWGRNDYGQLGVGDKVPRASPQLVPLTSRKAQSVALGGFHSAVLLDDGTLWTFGRNDFGQLGRQGDRQQPRKMIISGSPRVVSVALGRLHTALVVKSGLVYVCGYSTGGRLGDGGADNAGPAFVSSPVLVPLFAALRRNVTQVALGDTHTAFLTSLGELFLAGENQYSQLGAEASTTPRLIMNSSNISSIAVGSYHTAVLMHNNSLYTFGRNDQGQLGTATQALTSAVPLRVATDATAVSLGAFHSAYLNTKGELMMFGSNGQGQLGLGGKAVRATPTALKSSFGGTISAFSLGGSHTAVLRAATPTPTLTVTSTASATHTATLTTTPTPTPISATCDSASVNKSLAQSSVGFAVGTSCVQQLQAGVGSSSWQSRTLVLEIAQLQGTFSVLLTGGCVTGCAFSYGSGDQGTTQRIPLPSGTGLGMQLAYSTPAAASTATGRHRDLLQRAGSGSTAAVTVSVEYEGTAALLAASAVGATVLALLAVAALLWLYHWWTLRPTTRRWQVNPRFQRFGPKLSIAAGLWLLLTGVSYFIIAAATSSPIGPVALLAAGGALVGVGAALLLGFAAWVLRDPAAHHCYGCARRMNRWRFLGTYLPPLEDGSDVPRKAHTRCTRCVQCHKPAVTDGWAEAPPQRPYHARCWDTHCTSMVGDATYTDRWLTQHAATVTETELAHMLAVAVAHSAAPIVHQLMTVSPNLPSVPVAQERGSNAMRLAARCGNLPILCQLLQSEPYCLDPACTPERGAALSIAIKGLQDANDIYIFQPFVTYNDRPIYVGTDHGRYIFYYDPAEDTGKNIYAPGWCLSSHLGSGSNSLRLPLPDPLRNQDRTSLKTLEQGRGGRRKWHQRLYTRGRGRFPFSGTERSGEDIVNNSFAGHLGTITAEDLHLEWICHATSLLEEAITSGDRATIDHVKLLYQLQDPGCLTWKWHTGHGLWHTFSPAAQGAIRKALAEGLTSCTLNMGRYTNDPATLDFKAMRITTRGTSDHLKCCMRTVFQYPDSLTDNWVPTSDAGSIPNWQKVVVVFTPGHVSFNAPNLDTLAFLCSDGVVDYSLWHPPSKVGSRRPQVQSERCESMFKEVFKQEVTAVMGLTSTVSIPSGNGGFGRSDDGKGRAATADTGIGGRLTDGLEAPQSNQGVVFYPPHYSSDLGTLPFCAQLPDNSAGYLFELEPIIEMAADTLMKVHEMQRQLSRISPRHVVAIFVYTYELAYPSEGFDQIYAAMNKAMRLRQLEQIEFWRPLVWEIDMALMAFPTYRGKCYRGINCKMDATAYQTGTHICWPSFSSASQSLSVAEEFAKGDEGTLFFLSSVGARPISAVSRFPEEAEVLFPSNSVFTITSTLHSQSEIGAFYGRIDNVAMAQCGGEVAPAVQKVLDRPVLVGHTSWVLHVPTEASSQLLDLLSQVGVQVLETLEPQDGLPDIVAELVLVPPYSDGSEAPWPADMFPAAGHPADVAD